jgi:hypothetical protein
MKMLGIVMISLAAAIGPTRAQQVPGQGAMVPSSPPRPPTQVKVLTIKHGPHAPEFCNQGQVLESLSAVQVADDKNVSVILLNQEKADIKPDTGWTSASGFRFEHDPKEDVRVTMFCGG